MRFARNQALLSHTPPHPCPLPCRRPRPEQVFKEKLEEALQANQALQAQLAKRGAGASAAAAAALAPQNKENAAR